MINRFIPLFAVIVLLFFATPVMSQPEAASGYSIRHFTDEDGLPQNSINDLLFDRDGYLWLASQVGLVRFNGNSFTLYYPDDKPVMESNVVTLGKDEEGHIYFQTLDHHLYCYSGNNSQFLSPVNTPSDQRPRLLNRCKQVFDFNRFLQDAGPDEARRRQAIFQRLFANPENFFVADTGSVYLIDRDSLYYYDGSLHLLSPMEGHAAQCLVYDHRLYVLHRDSVSSVYAGGIRIGAAMPIEGDLKRDGPARPGAPARSYRLYSCGRVDHLLSDHRLYRLFPAKDGHIRSQYLADLDFIPNISSIEYNAGLDLLLISTHTEGFYFLRRNHFRINGWTPALQDQLSRHRFGPMALHKDREILTDKFIFTPAGSMAPVKDSGPVWQRCLFIDKKDQVWAARDAVPRRLSSAMDPIAELPALDANIVDYAQDREGNLYSLTERSLWRLDSDGFRKAYTPPVQAEQQQNESMAFVGAHRLWIASTNGLIEYDPEKKTSHPIPELSSTHVRAIHVCRDGSVLIGTYGAGYFYYYHQRFFRMPMDKNGYLVTAHCFLEDRKGMVWIPCNKGLFKTPKADMDAWCKGENDQLYYYYYGRQDGLRTNEFNGGFNASGVITPEGFVALLSMKGMVCFYADSLETDFPQGSIVMAHLEVDGKAVARTDTVRLSAGYNSLVLEISCPYPGDRNNLYLQYNLSGLNDEWKEIPEDGLLNLSRLAPGNYSLRVRKVNGFGRNNYQYRLWSIIVPPNFYRTPWFFVLLGLLVLAMAIWLIQLRLKLVEKKKEIRISQQALLKTNKQREKLISLVIHDLRSPLRFLTMLASDLHDNQGSLSETDLKERTYSVKKGAQDIYHFSEDFLLWVTSQKDNFKVSKQLFFVRPLLQEIYDFYLEQVQQNGNRFSYAADDTLQVWSDPHLVITIIRNLTDNANKFTSQGEIRIIALRDGVDLLIHVADTGRGMSPQQAAAFLGEDNLDNVRSGSQLGHTFIVDLTRRLNGALSVETGTQTGTTVTLRIPMDPPPPPGETGAG
ncbi:MAG TPA: ATP-binding protein [Puia sp.]|nr:ATP-binding protein [Puia sp.]